MRLVYGIDPGQKGGIACLNAASKEVILYWKMDEWEEAVLHMAAQEGKAQVILEAAQSMPGQGVKSVFSYGTGYGRLIGWMEALSIPYQTVHPRVWTKQMLAGVPTDLEKKERNREAFKRLYPTVYKQVLNKNGQADLGICDACLIGRWGCINGL